MERDDDLGNLYDAGAEEDRRYDDWRQQQVDDEWREQEIEEALNEALQKGVSPEHLKVLAREAGCVRWALEKSLRSE
jgi:hypothetical protein